MNRGRLRKTEKQVRSLCPALPVGIGDAHRFALPGRPPVGVEGKVVAGFNKKRHGLEKSSPAGGLRYDAGDTAAPRIAGGIQVARRVALTGMRASEEHVDLVPEMMLGKFLE